MSQDKFEWNDDLVAEYAGQCILFRKADMETFKEEKTKRDWEIVEMVGKYVGRDNMPFKKGVDDKFYPDDVFFGYNTYPLEELLKHGLIRAVKRLSDGEVFSVGDEVEVDKIDEPKKWVGVIDGFWVSGCGGMHICYNGHHYDIKYFKKVTKPKLLFTTEDGVEIFDGEVYVYYVSEYFNIRACKAKNVGAKRPVYASEKLAEEHRMLNKPLLSLSDLLDCWYAPHQSQYGVPFYRENVYNEAPAFQRFKKLAKDKLSK